VKANKVTNFLGRELARGFFVESDPISVIISPYIIEPKTLFKKNKEKV